MLIIRRIQKKADLVLVTLPPLEEERYLGSQRNKLQASFLLPSTEAEYVALTEAVKETLYIARLMEELGFDVKLPVRIHEDNTSAIKIAENPICHEKTKHIHPKYHFIREWIEKNYIQLEHLHTSEMPADMLTKALPSPLIRKFNDVIGLLPFTSSR